MFSLSTLPQKIKISITVIIIIHKPILQCEIYESKPWRVQSPEVLLGYLPLMKVVPECKMAGPTRRCTSEFWLEQFTDYISLWEEWWVIHIWNKAGFLGISFSRYVLQDDPFKVIIYLNGYVMGWTVPWHNLSHHEWHTLHHPDIFQNENQCISTDVDIFKETGHDKR